MTKVNIVEKFNTSQGVIIVTKDCGFKIGESVCDESGAVYKINGIQMPTKPLKENVVCLIVN